MKQVSMIGLDLAKNVFQVHGIDASGKVVMRRQLRRSQMEKFFAGLARGVVIGMEACGGAHHWGRLAQKHGHEVRMMPATYVKPYVKRNKNDDRDAEGVCEAMGRPTMRFVPVKSVDTQAALALHRTRRLLVRQRTMTANALRSALAEFGMVAATGWQGLRSLIEAVDDPASAVPQAARMPLQILARQWERLNADIGKMDDEIVRAAKSDAVARRLMAIPGLGPIGATAILAAVPDAGVFNSGRDFAAWLGLTPRQFSSGGKQRSGGISKQGDRALRTLLTEAREFASASGAQARHQGSLAASPAGTAPVQGCGGRLCGQDGAHDLGDARHRRVLSRAQARRRHAGVGLRFYNSGHRAGEKVCCR
jgi:transposase